MKVCFALLYQNDADADPESFLERARPLRYIPPEIARWGHEVEVVVSFATRCELRHDGVTFRFVPESGAVRRFGRVAARQLDKPPASLTPTPRAIGAIRTFAPDLIHFHGTNLYLNLALLQSKLGRRGPPLVVQYHGGFPSRHRAARRLQRRCLGRVARVLFTTSELARPFTEARMFDSARVVELIETSTTFRPTARPEARKRTGMHGDPLFLWVGRLDPVKDPMTALRGFDRIVARWPGARLYLHYLDDSLLPDLRAYANTRPRLRDTVCFGGPVAFDRMEDVFNSADFLLQSSRREFSGYAVLEALACRVVPVVTDIPSFRAITGGGRHGILFPPGDHEALARRVIETRPTDLAELARTGRAWFQQALSFPALAARLDLLYRTVVAEHAHASGVDPMRAHP